MSKLEIRDHALVRPQSRRIVRSVVEQVRRRLEDDADRVVLRFLPEAEAAPVELSFADVDREARRLAAALQAQGAMGERVLILLAPGMDYALWLLACLYAGAVAVPAYPPRNRTLERLASVVADAQARFAIASAQDRARLLERMPADSPLTGLVWLDTADNGPSAADWREPALALDTLALLQYTSGSTSQPKGVCLSHGNFIANVDALSARLRGQPHDHIVSWLPPYHDMGLVLGIMTPLLAGLQGTLMGPAQFQQRPARWLEAISQYRASISGAPNFAYELCVRRVVDPEQIAGLDLSSWRVAFSGAERVRPETMERFAKAFAPAGLNPSALMACYGLAESTVAVSFSRPGTLPALCNVDTALLAEGRIVEAGESRQTQTLVGCGEVLAGAELRVVDPQSATPVADGMVGEIWTRGPSVASGYWRKAELNREVFAARIAGDGEASGLTWLRTGDLGFLRRGELFVTGRVKDLIILRGANHYPEDFEGSVREAWPELATALSAAFSIDADGEERLILVQEVPKGCPQPLADFAAEIRAELVRHHEIQVSDVVLVSAGTLPRTSSGKIQRGRVRAAWLADSLRVLATASAATAGPASAAGHDTVERVCALMADVLGLPSVLPSDDFFWLGGHSLLATQLASRIRATFAVELPLRCVFESPNARALAGQILLCAPTDAVPPILPLRPDQPRLLSFSQERMWMLHQLDPLGAAYNVAGALVLEGDLQMPALQAALDEVVRRHEVLRTRYPAVDGNPAVVLDEQLSLPIAFHDLSDQPDPQQLALTAASRMAQRPFAIATDPLMRCAVWRLGPQRHVLSAVLHHLVTDGWSTAILVQDLLRFHDLLVAGQPLPAVTTRVSYLDYAAWQRSYLGEGRLAEDLAYWQQQLSGASPVDLPSDRPRSARRSSQGGYVPAAMSQELMQALTALGAAQGTTLFMVLLAAFEVLLYRHTGSSDLVVGVPVANRNHLASEHLIGSLVNTLALRLRFDPEQPFQALLRQVREVALDAYAHQDMPFERLVSSLSLERRAGESPLVSVMFDYQNPPMLSRSGSGLRARPAVVSRASAQFDLSLLIFDTELGRMAGIEYRKDLFSEAAMERLMGHYLAILEQIVLDPQQAPARIPLLARSERETLLALASPERSPEAAPVSVPTLIAQQAVRSPDALAVSDDHGCLSYRELEQQSDALAAALRLQGAASGERVAVLLERTQALVVALLAVLKSGAAYVPLDPSYPGDRIAYVLEDCQPRIVLTSSGLLGLLPADLHERVLCLDRMPTGIPAPGACIAGPVAYLLYTSGSTGRPKGVEVSNASLANFLRSMGRTPGMAAGDRVLALTTVAFDIAGLEIWLPLTHGASVRLVTAACASDPTALMAVMTAWRPTLLQATPATWKMLLAADWPGDPGLRMLCGGEALPPELAATLLTRGHSLWNMYGPTETTIWSAVHRVTAADAARVPIGRPIDHTRIYVLDHLGQLQPRGVIGELYIAGAGVANGYFGREELTRERFTADPFAGNPGGRMYRTGDGGRLREDGTFECMARLDDQIKLRGFRIEPGEIEAVMKEDPQVVDAVVVAREVQPGDVRLAGYYVRRGPIDADPVGSESELRAHLQRRLPAYMMPSALMVLPALPKTPNGKIDRKALPAPRFEGSAGTSAFVAPRDDMERELADLWQELLGTPEIGVRDSFFSLGGYSLLAMRMLARIQQRYGCNLPPALLFEHATIELLAQQIRLHQVGTVPVVNGSFDYLVPIQTGGRHRPMFCVHGAGGNVYNFAELAAHIGSERPLFAFQARGVDGTGDPHRTIADMAQAYLAELRKVQAHGPYLLAGYCGGGIIAFDMACRLRAEGERVDLLAMIDCYRPGVVRHLPRTERWATGIRDNGMAHVPRRLSAWASRMLGELTVATRIWYHRSRGLPVPFELREPWLMTAFLQGAGAYQAPVYPGPLTLLRAHEVDPELQTVSRDLGWSDRAGGGFSTFDVPGDHHSLLREPNVRVLGETLALCLERIEADDRS